MIEKVIGKYKTYGPGTFTRYCVAEFARIFYWGMLRSSYSQKGEDLVIDRLLGYKKVGFYVDIGAYNPHRFSNTKRFYKRGWSGINVEPDALGHKEFLKYRTRDINLNIGVGSGKASMVFYRMDPAAASTFSEAAAREYQKQGFKVVDEQKIQVRRLEAVLEEYACNKRIDFISIDTEGLDLDVLKSNNWVKYRPRLICIESSAYKGSSKENEKMSEALEHFLNSVNYNKVYDNRLNSIYRDCV